MVPPVHGLLVFYPLVCLAPSKDLDSLSLDLFSQSRMQAIAGRKVDMSVQAFLQDRLNVDQIKRVESIRPLRLDEYVDIAVDAGQVASGRSEEVERADSMRSHL